MSQLPATIAAIALLLFLAACSGLRPASTPVAEPEPPAAVPPIVSDRFLLPADGSRLVGRLQVIEAQYEDTFVDIARAYNLGFDELVDANPGVDPWLPGVGAKVLLPTRFILPDAPAEGIVVNIASKRLFYFPPADADGVRAVVTYPIGIGQEGTATPVGTTTVTSKGRDPVWYVPASIRRKYAAEGNPLPAQVPPGPENPLGRHVLVLGMPSYLIHGTNRPAGVGMRVSHGCVRLFPENIEHLYEQAPVGTPVTIVNQPWLHAWDEDGQLHIEVHRSLEDDTRDWSVAAMQKRIADAVSDGKYSVPPDSLVAETLVNDALGVPLPAMASIPDYAAALARALTVNNLSTSAVNESAFAALSNGD